MFRAKIPLEQRLRFEDFLRSLGYIALAVWAVLYSLYPSAIVNENVQPWVQYLWMGVSIAGALLAVLGCILKIDIKLELPGILFMLVGPLLYFATTSYRAFTRAVEGLEQPAGLVPLIVYSLLPVLLLLPRIFSMYSDALSSRNIGEDQGGTK